jgi:hypothetical protein
LDLSIQVSLRLVQAQDESSRKQPDEANSIAHSLSEQAIFELIDQACDDFGISLDDVLNRSELKDMLFSLYLNLTSSSHRHPSMYVLSIYFRLWRRTRGQLGAGSHSRAVADCAGIQTAISENLARGVC